MNDHADDATQYHMEDGVIYTKKPNGLSVFSFPKDYGDSFYHEKVVEVGNTAFTNNYMLKKIELPNCEAVKNWGFWNCKNLLCLSLPKLKILGTPTTKEHGISPISANSRLHVIQLPLEPPEFYSEKMFSYQQDKIFLVVPDIARYESIKDELGLEDFELVQLPPNGKIEVNELYSGIIEVKIGDEFRGVSYPSRKWVRFPE